MHKILNRSDWALFLTALLFSYSTFPILSLADEGPEELALIMRQFEELRSDLDSEKEKFADRYRSELKLLDEKATASANLDLALAVRAETAEFEERKQLETPSEFPELARLQEIYQTQSELIAKQRNSKLAVLAEGYLTKLVGLQADYTRQSQLDAAVTVRDEIGRVRSLLEIAKANETEGAKTDTPNLIGHWTFDADGSDSSGNERNARISGGAEIVPGKIGAGALRTGRGKYAEIPHSPDFDLTHPFTLSVWVKANASVDQVAWAPIFTKGKSTWRIQMNAGGKGVVFHLNVTNSAKGNPDVNLPSSDFKPGEWLNLVAVFDGESTAFYIDGKKRGSWEGSSDLTVNTNTANLRIGGLHLTDREFEGLIDDVRIYNRALTNGEINGLFRQASP